MMQPKKTKFRRAHKGRIKGNTKAGAALNFGSHGLKALEPNRVNAREIEAARRAITREMKRQGRVWIRIFPDIPVSKKPTEVRMGSGKGAPEFWAARVAPGNAVAAASAHVMVRNILMLSGIPLFRRYLKRERPVVRRAWWKRALF